jgi:hypothetical protein
MSTRIFLTSFDWKILERRRIASLVCSPILSRLKIPLLLERFARVVLEYGRLPIRIDNGRKSSMGSNSIIAAIDKELARLREVRSLLTQKVKQAKKASGRTGAGKKQSKRQLSPAARAKIAEGQRKRWAAVKKAKKG